MHSDPTQSWKCPKIDEPLKAYDTVSDTYKDCNPECARCYGFDPNQCIECDTTDFSLDPTTGPG